MAQLQHGERACRFWNVRKWRRAKGRANTPSMKLLLDVPEELFQGDTQGRDNPDDVDHRHIALPAFGIAEIGEVNAGTQGQLHLALTCGRAVLANRITQGYPDGFGRRLFHDCGK